MGRTFIAKMLKTAFLLSLVLLSAQAKTRKGPFPAKVWEKLRNEPLVDEDESKIVGGTDVEDLSERPYQIAMLKSGRLRCGGAIIGDDICLLITSDTINAPGSAKATLPTGPMEFSPGDEFVVSGWGTTSSGGSISATLKQVTVPFVSDAECDSDYSAYGGVDDETMICAGEEGVDSCQGDSGGPMTAYGVHVGIVSWGVGCARRGYPGVYGQTDAFVSWINDNTAG